ncbi:MAG: mannitol dehydrogenase family protein, partial [Pseudomonadota bacterium]
CAGMREDGSEISDNDPLWAELVRAARTSQSTPEAWLDRTNLYGDLAQADAFRSAFGSWLKLLWAEGSVAAMARYAQGQP